MSIRAYLSGCRIEADEPEEMVKFILAARAAGLIAQGAQDGTLLNDPEPTAAAVRGLLSQSLSNRLSRAKPPVPQQEVLAAFWERLGTPTLRAIVHWLAASPDGVTKDKLLEVLHVRSLAGVIGGLGKNSHPDFVWGDFMHCKDDTYRLERGFAHALRQMLYERGLNPFTPPDSNLYSLLDETPPRQADEPPDELFTEPDHFETTEEWEDDFV